MKKHFTFAALFLSVALVNAAKFEISLRPGLATNALEGRLLLVLSTTNNPEPRFAIESIDARGPFDFGRDAKKFTSKRPLVIDESATAGLDAKLSQIPAGKYFAQAVLDVSTDLRGVNMPGNLFSKVHEIEFNPHSRKTFKLELALQILDRTPADNANIKYVKIQSKLLSEFHQRPIFLRAAVLLPTSYAREAERRYPLWIHIDGYGARYTDAIEVFRHELGGAWLATNAPQMIFVMLDGAGPNGDPYQVNSANNGPYGDAVVTELIPHIERTFRAVGGERGHMLSGKSTGGWASLALQIFYPDFFGGVWSWCPDSVDFRAYQLANIYEDENAFVNHHGEEHPSARDENGDTRLLMRREVQFESVLGRGGNWTRSGRQWGAWNAVYGPRGDDGLPVPLWDENGKINHAVAEQWKKYDLRLVLETNWSTLAPKLRGKIHIAVGDADDYFLNNAVHLLEDALRERTPKDVATFRYGPGAGHGWLGMSWAELLRQIFTATEAKP